MNVNQQRWENLAAVLNVTPDEGEFERLILAYSESHRAYHTLQHLSECLERFDWAVTDHIFQNSALAEMALWYHDAIYQPRASDNERRSAEWAYGFLNKSGIRSEECKLVHSIIMATRHDQAPREPMSQLVVDIDLSILGAEPARFVEYEKQVREEYQWVPGFLYKKKRRKLLQAFLDRPRLYCTELFYRAYEHRARENLKRSIAWLK